MRRRQHIGLVCNVVLHNAKTSLALYGGLLYSKFIKLHENPHGKRHDKRKTVVDLSSYRPSWTSRDVTTWSYRPLRARKTRAAISDAILRRWSYFRSPDSVAEETSSWFSRVYRTHCYRSRPMSCTDAFGFPLRFRSVLRHFRLPSTTARGVRYSSHLRATTAAGRIVVSSPSLISVSHFFAQPAKMVWITVDDKVSASPSRTINFPCFLRALAAQQWLRIGANYDLGEIKSRSREDICDARDVCDRAESRRVRHLLRLPHGEPDSPRSQWLPYSAWLILFFWMLGSLFLRIRDVVCLNDSTDSINSAFWLRYFQVKRIASRWICEYHNCGSIPTTKFLHFISHDISFIFSRAA